MFVNRKGGELNYVAKYKETDTGVASRKTGILVNLSQALDGELIAKPHLVAGTKPSGFAYIDPQTKSRGILVNGSAGQKADTFYDGESVVVYVGSGQGLTDQVADGEYYFGTSLTVDTNARLKVAGEGDISFAKVVDGATVASQNKSIEVEYDF